MGKIKIAFLVESKEIQYWQNEIVEKVASNNNFVLDCIFVPGEIESVNEKKDSGNKNILFKIYRKLDQIIFGNGYLNKVKLTGNFNYVPLDYIKRGYRDIFSSEAVDVVNKRNIDVIIRLGFRIISGDILTAAKYGIWSYHHGDNRFNRGGPAGFWEIFNQENVTGATLQVLSETLDGGTVIDKCYTKTIKHSLVKNKESIIRASNILLFAKLGDLQENEKIQISNRTKNDLDIYERNIYLSPNVLNLLRFFTIIIKSLASLIYNKFFVRDEWFIAYKKRSSDSHSINLSFLTFLENEKGFFSADPFLFNYENKNWIFYEKCKITGGKGFLEAFCIEDGTRSPVLSEEWHLSYPNIWKGNDGNIYLMPQSDNGQINIYKNLSFPSEWILINTLVKSDIHNFGDATFYNVDGFNSLIFTVYEHNLEAHNCLYSINNVDLYNGMYDFNQFELLKIDVRNARPAGNALNINDKFYRISQDCSQEYGKRININQIKKDDLFGTLVDTIDAQFLENAIGIHTLNVNGEYLCVDYKKKLKSIYLK